MIGSGIRIEQALRIIGDQNAKRPEGSVLLNVRGAILEGRSFAVALGEHPRVFPDYYRASVAAGEQSGQLDAVLAHLTDFVERRERSQRKVQLALIYPALLAVVSMLIVGLMLVYVVPDITRVFVSRGAELPLLTRGLIGLSDMLQKLGWIMVILLAAGVLATRQWLQSEANVMTVARLIAQQPPTARFSMQMNAARFAGSLSTLVRSGVPLVDAVNAAAAVTPRRVSREVAMASLLREHVRRKDGLALLFAPPFDKTAHDPGYIKGYPPGIRENGGQYTHAAIWTVMAFAQLGETQKAWDLFAMINPVLLGSTARRVAVYKVEPYVVAADVYSAAPHTGRGGWSWSGLPSAWP
jgi:hypothetical protein